MAKDCATGKIAAVSRKKDTIEVAWIGKDRSIQKSYWYEGGKWSDGKGPQYLALPGTIEEFSNIVGVSRNNKNFEFYWMGVLENFLTSYQWNEGKLPEGKTVKIDAHETVSPPRANVGSISAISIGNYGQVWWVSQVGTLWDAMISDEGIKVPNRSLAQKIPLTSTIAAIHYSKGLFICWIGKKGSVNGRLYESQGTVTDIKVAPEYSASSNSSLIAISRRPETIEMWWNAPDGSIIDGFHYV